MNRIVSRVLLGMAAVFLLFGATLHTLAFPRAVAAVTAAGSNLPTFFGAALKGLWLIDSSVLVVLGLTFGLLALRPTLASNAIILLLGLIPALAAAALYVFVGPFPPAHLMAAVAMCVLLAGVLRARV